MCLPPAWLSALGAKSAPVNAGGGRADGMASAASHSRPASGSAAAVNRNGGKHTFRGQGNVLGGP